MAGATILAIAWLAGCGGTPQAADHPKFAAPTAPAAPPRGAGARPAAPDPDLDRPPPKKLLSIDWSKTPLAAEADALAAWEKIAPTGLDWEERLDEVPADAVRPLAVAMLRAGNFTCVAPPPAMECAPLQLDVPEPAPSAGLTDPCLRRLLALWSIAQLDPNDLPAVKDALRAVAAIPPPESQLVSTAMRAVPAWEKDLLLSMIVIAARAGQRDIVNEEVARLDEARLIEAATKHHVDGALEVLSAEGHRGAYLAAVVDEDLTPAARIRAIADLVAAADTATDPAGAAAPGDRPRAAAATPGRFAPDLQAALVKATAAKDCGVAAAAARALEQRGDRRFVPSRPRARTPEAMMRALCVLASYEPLAREGEPPLLAGYVPPKGLERVLVEYDALSDTDLDGDGDPHTKRSIDLLPRSGLALPEPEDLARAMKRCTGTLCRSADREFHFAFKPAGGELYLSRLEIIERPPCP
jgi:hypothetical protein